MDNNGLSNNRFWEKFFTIISTTLRMALWRQSLVRILLCWDLDPTQLHWFLRAWKNIMAVDKRVFLAVGRGLGMVDWWGTRGCCAAASSWGWGGSIAVETAMEEWGVRLTVHAERLIWSPISTRPVSVWLALRVFVHVVPAGFLVERVNAVGYWFLALRSLGSFWLNCSVRIYRERWDPSAEAQRLKQEDRW